jgi:hypothetical protein
MKLYPISTGRLQVVEAGQFINRWITDFENSGQDAASDAEFKILFEKIKNQWPTFNDALKQARANAESQALLLLDERRDQKVAVVKRATSVFEFSDYKTELAAYGEIMVVLRKYKNVETNNYEKESLSIDNMISEIRTAKNESMITLGLKTHVEVLEAANNEFKELFSTRSTEVASTISYDTKALRTAIFADYKTLANYVELMVNMKGTPFFLAVLNVMNTGRAYFAEVIARRKGTKKKADPEQ